MYAGPIILYARGGTCSLPWLIGLTVMVNSNFNGWRMEHVCFDE